MDLNTFLACVLAGCLILIWGYFVGKAIQEGYRR